MVDRRLGQVLVHIARVTVIVEELAPAACRRTSTCPQSVATPSLHADVVTERAQLTLDSSHTPVRVLTREPRDQFACFDAEVIHSVVIGCGTTKALSIQW